MPDTEILTEPTQIINEDGSFSEEWYKKYDESYHPTLSRFKTFDDFVNSDMSARKKFGKDPESLIEIPSPDADENIKAEFYRKLGVPDDVAKYEFKKSGTLSGNISLDDNRIKEFAGIAKKYNLNPDQFNGVVNDYLSLIDNDITSMDKALKEQEQRDFADAETALKKIMGKTYDERVNRANLILRKYAGGEIRDDKGNVTGTIGEKLDEVFPKLKNSPWMAMVLDAIAQDMSEDRIKGITSVAAQSPAEIENRIRELKNHPGYYDKSHPEHKELQKRAIELYKLKNAS